MRWYCKYAISYRDLAEMTPERGVEVDHTTILCWVQTYAPEIEKRVRCHQAPRTDGWRVGAQADDLRAALAGQHLVVSALASHLCPAVCEAAIDIGVHYLDTSGDVEELRAVATGYGVTASSSPAVAFRPGSFQTSPCMQ